MATGTSVELSPDQDSVCRDLVGRVRIWRVPSRHVTKVTLLAQQFKPRFPYTGGNLALPGYRRILEHVGLGLAIGAAIVASTLALDPAMS